MDVKDLTEGPKAREGVMHGSHWAHEEQEYKGNGDGVRLSQGHC